MAINETVEYRDIPNWPGYRVGDDGSMWMSWQKCWQGRMLTNNWRPLILAINGKGYHSVNLTPPEGGRYKTFRVHRLVLLAFVGPCPSGMECRHLNGIKTDNRLENLVWGTKKENASDNYRNGTYNAMGRAKLYMHDGQTKCLKEWADHFSIPYLCLWYRVSRLGMTFREAIHRPYRGTSSNGAHWTKLKKSK